MKNEYVKRVDASQIHQRIFSYVTSFYRFEKKIKGQTDEKLNFHG